MSESELGTGLLEERNSKASLEPLKFFSTKPGTTIIGIMERYPQILALGMKGGLRVIDDGLMAVR